MNETTAKDTRVYCIQGPSNLAATAEGVLSKLTFVFKDLFDVKSYATGAGNPAWLISHQPAQQTASVIKKLLAQGANCVGRVQTDELAYSLNGQNIHYGTPVNPLAPGCLPGGSSSGSAVVVANGEADFSIGTDTGGSVRVPASYCGLFGLRPTLGKLALDNTFELAKSFDTAGVFSKDLTMLSNVFNVLAEQKQQGQKATTLYLDNTLANQLSQQRLSGLKHWCEEANIELLSCNLLADTEQTLDGLSLLFRTIQGFEIIEGHDAWLKEHGDSLDPSIMQRVMWARSITQQQYVEAKAQQHLFQQKLISLFNEMHGLWILPTTPSGPPALTMEGDELAEYRSQLMGLTSIAGLAGFPQLHLPMQGLTEGPCGFSLMSIADKEADLIETGLSLWQGEQQ
ncbi:amidase [uncultured Psychromonas sp.]|uniref:amidase n=1 Tax=uncultured Psychromonas sp. TaxID=173974 RepID=UPI00262CBFC8|nr:amidase [uncultured Psychromonas sp.]